MKIITLTIILLTAPIAYAGNFNGDGGVNPQEAAIEYVHNTCALEIIRSQINKTEVDLRQVREERRGLTRLPDGRSRELIQESGYSNLEAFLEDSAIETNTLELKMNGLGMCGGSIGDQNAQLLRHYGQALLRRVRAVQSRSASCNQIRILCDGAYYSN